MALLARDDAVLYFKQKQRYIERNILSKFLRRLAHLLFNILNYLIMLSVVTLCKLLYGLDIFNLLFENLHEIFAWEGEYQLLGDKQRFKNKCKPFDCTASLRRAIDELEPTD